MALLQQLAELQQQGVVTPEEFAQETATHRALLSANVCIIEGLNMSPVEPGENELNCLPLSIRGADGAPARAVLSVLR